jgi:hypothetical protein
VQRTIIVLATALLLAAPQRGQAVYVMYEQWAALSPDDEALYIAGSIDALTTFAMRPPETFKTFRDYSSCLARSKMSAKQLAQNVKTFASTRPQLHTLSVGAALLQYLTAACLNGAE